MFLLDPLVYRMVGWFTNNIYYSFFVGIFFGLFFWDLASTLKLSTKIRKFAKDNQIAVKYEELKLMIKSSLDTEKLKSSFINPFKASGETIKATLAATKKISGTGNTATAGERKKRTFNKIKIIKNNFLRN